MRSGEHPRVRGENLTQALGRSREAGTSPRARGKRVRRVSRRSRGEHPRVRGENQDGGRFTITGSGTSPRARGKRGNMDNEEWAERNIPACAGKTGGNDIDRRFWGEHPRVRGENGSTIDTMTETEGTSPRARGKRFLAKLPGSLPKEHPRVRGENPVAYVHAARHGGTSPRARGKRWAYQQANDCSGNIPACAGKTCGKSNGKCC